MSKWEKVKLGDAFNLQMGKTPSRNNQAYWNDGANKWISIADIDLNQKYIYNTKETISDLAVAESGIKIVPKDTVIMSFKLSLGKTCILAEDMYTNEAIMAFINKRIYEIDNTFLFYLLKSRDWSTGTKKAVKGMTLNKVTLSNFEIPLPPLETQRQIAKTLDTASELLAMRKQQLAELDNLIKSVFYDMFGDPVENNIGWPVLKIQDIANVETGSTPKRSNINYYFDGSIPWVKTGEISNKYIYDLEEKITELALIETNCKLFPTDTLLIAMYGQGKTRGQIGMLKVEATTNQACAAILPNDQFVSQYLFKLLEIRYEDLRELGRGGNQPNLNLSMVKNFEIIMPPLSLQAQFASIVNKIEEQKALVQKVIDETQYLLDSLMSGYFDE